MATNISVYGYDQRMLVSDVPTRSADGSITESKSAMEKASTHQATSRSTQSPLLKLPIELRDRIHELVLPSSVEAGAKGIAWVRGHCAILATSKRIYHEAIRVVYGRNTFVVDVVWDGVTFAYQWVLPTGLVPKRTFAFPNKLAKRNIALIRKILIRIHHVDNYTGMVKHNFGGPGLREGLKIQVEELCQRTLQQMYEISHLHIHFQNDSHTMSVDQAILRPLMSLTNTRTLKLTGSITADLASTLQAQLTDAYSRNSIFRLPLELRERIYDLVLPSTEIKKNRRIRRQRLTQLRAYALCKEGHVEILRTCTTIHKEASRVFYRTRHVPILRQADGVLNLGRWPEGLIESPDTRDSLCWSSVTHTRSLVLCISTCLDSSEADATSDMETILETVRTITQLIPNIRELIVNIISWHVAVLTHDYTLKELVRVSGIRDIQVFGLNKEKDPSMSTVIG